MNIKRLTPEDIAMKNISLKMRTSSPAQVNVGDIVTIRSPWVKGEDYTGLVTEVYDDLMIIYHNKIKKKLAWPRRVKCEICKL